MSGTPLAVRAGVLASALAVALTGCGSAVENIVEGNVERAIENELGESADVEIGEDSFSVDTEDGSITAGAGSVPDDFPTDVPLVDGEVAFAQRLESDDGFSWNLIITSDADPGTLADQVRGELTDNGFSVEEASEFSGADSAGGTILAEKGDLTVLVLVAGDGSETSATYTVTQQP
jgi:hypothetical protein